MKILLSAERDTSFVGAYLRKMTEALAPHEVSVSSAGWREVLREGARSFDRVHFVFVPGRSLSQLREVIDVELGATATTVSLSTFGLHDVLKEPVAGAAFSALASHPRVARILVHSNAPRRAQSAAAGLFDPSYDSVRFVHDPIYDDPLEFTVSREEARRSLGVAQGSVVALYFGTFGREKGADLLFDAMRELVDLPSLVLAAVGRSPPRIALALPPNVIRDDRFVDYPTAARWFRATDVVVLPYRRDYDHNTSGVLVQAALAERPTLAPDIAPFADVAAEYGTGKTFACEDVGSLASRLRELVQEPWAVEPAGHRRYVAAIESWATLAAELVPASCGRLAHAGRR